jgi:hypothetical protein
MRRLQGDVGVFGLMEGENKVSPLLHPYSIVQCLVCGSLVPATNLPEHLLADARILRIIKSTHPEWDRQECECYLQAISGAERPADGG